MCAGHQIVGLSLLGLTINNRRSRKSAMTILGLKNLIPTNDDHFQVISSFPHFSISHFSFLRSYFYNYPVYATVLVRYVGFPIYIRSTYTLHKLLFGCYCMLYAYTDYCKFATYTRIIFLQTRYDKIKSIRSGATPTSSPSLRLHKHINSDSRPASTTSLADDDEMVMYRLVQRIVSADKSKKSE